MILAVAVARAAAQPMITPPPTAVVAVGLSGTELSIAGTGFGGRTPASSVVLVAGGRRIRLRSTSPRIESWDDALIVS
jgi:hypothetical protein